MHDGENIEMRPNGEGQTVSRPIPPAPFVKAGAEVGGVHLSRHSSPPPGNSECACAPASVPVRVSTHPPEA